MPSVTGKHRIKRCNNELKTFRISIVKEVICRLMTAQPGCKQMIEQAETWQSEGSENAGQSDQGCSPKKEVGGRKKGWTTSLS